MGEPVITCQELLEKWGKQIDPSLWMQHTCTETRTNSATATTVPIYPLHIPSPDTQTRHTHQMHTQQKSVDSSFHIKCQIEPACQTLRATAHLMIISSVALGWAEEYNSNGSISWGRGAVWCASHSAAQPTTSYCTEVGLTTSMSCLSEWERG